jgi:hypothetical protein
MDISLIRRLVVTYLRPFSRSTACLQLFVPAGDVAAEAAASSGIGLDLHSGERVLASLLMKAPSRVAVAITNHRTIVGGAGVGFAIRHDEVQGVELDGGVLELETMSGRHDLTVLNGHCEALAGFFGALARADISARVEAPSPTFYPGAGDPTGGQGAVAGLWRDDPEAAAMLGEIVRRERSGDLDLDDAQELVGRVILAHRARCCGPAAFGANYLAPLSAADFGHLLLEVLGVPANQRTPNPGINRLDFKVDGITVGVSYREVSGGCCFQLTDAVTRRLERDRPHLAHRLHQRIIAATYQSLVRITAAMPVFAHTA